MTAQERLIGTAAEQVGYMGKRSNSQLDEYNSNTSGKWNKYARALDALGDFYNGKKNGYELVRCVRGLVLCHHRRADAGAKATVPAGQVPGGRNGV